MAAKIRVIDYIPEWLTIDQDEYEALNMAINDCTIDEVNDRAIGSWNDLENTDDLV